MGEPCSGRDARKPFSAISDTDGNRPIFYEGKATAEENWMPFEHRSRAISIQNIGGNTLWFSLDKERWHYIMSGTSAGGGKVIVDGIWFCTQTGTTRFVVSVIAK